ncbi:sugar transferase [Floccifex sp.]|uniref:sugar transferase n=1 Tax=Floccifex sp. TaxID=2815810 RepID=UPI003F06A102
MFKKSPNGWLKHWDFMLLDLICLQLAFVVSYMLRHGFANPYANPLYLNMALFLILADIIVFFFYETFHEVLKRGYYKEFAVTVKHSILVVLLAVLYLFTMQEGEPYSRTALYLMEPIYVLFSYTFRILWKKCLKKKMKDGGERSLLIVTTSDMAEQVVFNIKDHNYELFHIAGLAITDKDMTGEKIAGISVVATEKDAVEYVCKEWVDEVFIFLSKDNELSQSLMDDFAETGVTVHLNLAKVSSVTGRKQLVEKVGNYTVLTTSMNYMTPKQAFMKRTLDIIGGLAGCVITGILFVFIAPAIYIQSPGPIFFSQPRVGKNGKIFKMYKFRSMYMDAEERKAELMDQNRVKDGLMFKLDFDPRVIGNKVLPDGTKKTGIGEFIRKTSIDEFPQFWNVLTGSMSLCGTRPALQSETALYSPHHRARLAVKPGITGMWQANGRSEITDFEEVVKLDTQYINEWSFGLDIKIILKTAKAVLTGDGAM